MYFPSKVLLIGEQTVLHGSQSLTIPFDQYGGRWQFEEHVDQRLVDLVELLDDSIIDVEAFNIDCEKGLSFQSTIPLKSGLGSSGALTAALYKSYARSSETEIDQLKSELATIESIFHGKSSGTDALVSYCGAAIHSVGLTSYLLKDNPLNTFSGGVYLFDSNIDRSAKTYIQRFTELVNDRKIDINQMNGLCQEIIGYLLEPSTEDDVLHSVKSLSELQFIELDFFIPDHVKGIWKTGLQTDEYYFKLCGAGGGGFFLVFTKHLIRSIQGRSLITLNPGK